MAVETVRRSLLSMLVVADRRHRHHPARAFVRPDLAVEPVLEDDISVVDVDEREVIESVAAGRFPWGVAIEE